MKAKGIFISTLLVIDTFFISYAVGFNSHPVLVVDPALPPVAKKPSEKGKPDTNKASADKKVAEKAPVAKDAVPNKAAATGKAKAKGAKHHAHHATP